MRITSPHATAGLSLSIDEHANDLVHRQTMLVTRDADSAASGFIQRKSSLFLLA